MRYGACVIAKKLSHILMQGSSQTPRLRLTSTQIPAPVRKHGKATRDRVHLDAGTRVVRVPCLLLLSFLVAFIHALRIHALRASGRPQARRHCLRPPLHLVGAKASVHPSWTCPKQYPCPRPSKNPCGALAGSWHSTSTFSRRGRPRS